MSDPSRSLQPEDLSTSHKKSEDDYQQTPPHTPSPGNKTLYPDHRTPSPLDPTRPDVIPKSAPMNSPFSTAAPLDLSNPFPFPFPFGMLGGMPANSAMMAQLAKGLPQDLHTQMGLLMPPNSLGLSGSSIYFFLYTS